MLSDDLLKRLKEDIDFKRENIDTLIDQIIETDDQKKVYSKGIRRLEKTVLVSIETVNKTFDDVANAYQAAIDSDCRSDLFWRVIDVNNVTELPEYTLECTRLNFGGYRLTGSNLSTVDFTVGLGATVGFVGTSGNVTYYPVNQTYANIFEEEFPSADITNDPYFGFDRRNRYGLKYYSEPYDKDIGDTLVGEFIGTCTIGSNFVTVMQDVGLGVTFGTEQIVLSVGKTDVLPLNAKIVGVTTNNVDLRSIPTSGIGSTSTTVLVLELDTVCSAGASAPEADGSFVEFRVLDDPVAFREGGRRRYDIPFDQDPFVPQTISIASTGNVGRGVSVFLDNSGALSNPQSWDSNFKILPLDQGGTVEPEVGAGQAIYKVGFGHAPLKTGSVRAQEGDTRIVSSATTNLGGGLYTQLSSCSTEVQGLINTTLGISSTFETDLKNRSSITSVLLDTSQALRRERNSLQLGIHGIRKMLGVLNEELRGLRNIRKFIKNADVTPTIDDE